MSELQFPKNPAVGQEYDFPPYKYYWDGVKWKTKGTGYALKEAITALGGELDPTAKWLAVPAHSDAEIGGPMNAQAEALAARTKLLHTEVLKALRRSYAEAGYNLVDGSFEAGGTLVNANDVLLHEASGLAFSGVGPFSQTVNAGTTPSSVYFIDRSGELLRANMAASAGASLIGAAGGGTVQDKLDIYAIPTSTINNRAASVLSADSTTLVTPQLGIIHTGQSLAEGGITNDITKAMGPLNARCKTFVGGPVGLDVSVLENRSKVISERNRATIANTMADYLQVAGVSSYVFFSGQAWGGKTYAELKKGGVSGVYEKCIAQVTTAKEMMPSIKYLAITNIHGESDGKYNVPNYAANLSEWQANFNADIRAITGQAETVKMFLCQTSTAGGGYGFAGGITENEFPIPLEQLKAHETYPNVILVGPKYQFKYGDYTHITNQAQAQLGLLYADAIQHTLRVGKWEPVRPSAIVVKGNKVVITFVGSRLSQQHPLVFDEVNVLPIANKGFAYTDSLSRTITSVAITKYNEVTLTLSGTAGSNRMVAYAYHNGTSGVSGNTSQHLGLGDRGNLRTTYQLNGLYGAVYHWAVTFRKAV